MSFLDRFRAPSAPSLSPADFKARRRPDDVVLDVRTPAEFAGGHVAGAVLMDAQAADFRARAAGLDPAKTYYVYCRSGNRSGQAAAILREAGLAEVYNVGGLDALARAGVEVRR